MITSKFEQTEFTVSATNTSCFINWKNDRPVTGLTTCLNKALCLICVGYSVNDNS